MNNLTRNGVCKDLYDSPYVFSYLYKNKVIYLSFSSKLHLDNFVKNRNKNYVMIYNSIYKRFKFKIDCTLLSDFNLYRKIENRGCYIKFGNKVYTDLKDISLN